MRFAVLALLAGCDALFSITNIPAPPDGPVCPQDLYPTDHFTGDNLPCMPWGRPTNNAGPTLSVGVDGGGLGVTIDDVAVKRYNGCYTTDSAIDPDEGLSIEVDNPLRSGALYTVFHAYASDDANVSAAFVATGDALEFRTGPDPATEVLLAKVSFGANPKWWRFRIARDGLAGDYSPDRIHWTEIATAPGTIGRVDIDFGAGTSATAAPTPAPTVVFRNLNACPI